MSPFPLCLSNCSAALPLTTAKTSTTAGLCLALPLFAVLTLHRGFTAGIVGFTTATHDAIQVIQSYKNENENATEFDSILPALTKINQTGSSSTSTISSFCDIWSSTAKNRLEFRTAQLELADSMYFNPSQALALDLGLSSLSRGQIYDAFIQHGPDNDPDSARSMVTRTKTAMTTAGKPESPALGADQSEWLDQFLTIRTNTLKNPSNKASQAGWSKTVTRVQSYSYALKNGQINFNDSLIALDNDGAQITVPCRLELWTEFVPVSSNVSSKSGLSAGVIAGIVIAVLVVVGGAGFFGWRWWEKHQEKMEFSELKDRLLFAIPKKGRLNEKCLQILSGADIQFTRSNRLDIALSTNLPIAIVFLPAADIAQFVANGNIDIGITGQDIIAESNVKVDNILELGFGKCDLCIQVPESSSFKTPEDLVGKRIVTSFDGIATRYFEDLDNIVNLRDG
ncbi:ATP phosphoribosyltransferase (ATP-PRTase) (ATP-PRT), partial [Nowakowskiella sp. JEL0078]